MLPFAEQDLQKNKLGEEACMHMDLMAVAQTEGHERCIMGGERAHPGAAVRKDFLTEDWRAGVTGMARIGFVGTGKSVGYPGQQELVFPQRD